MTGILKFDLPEEQYEYQAAIFGWRYMATIQGLDEQLRQWLKHGHVHNNVDDFMEHLRRWLREEAPEAFLDE